MPTTPVPLSPTSASRLLPNTTEAAAEARGKERNVVLKFEKRDEMKKNVKRTEGQREMWVRGAGGGKDGVEEGVEEAREGRRGRGSGRGDRRKER